MHQSAARAVFNALPGGGNCKDRCACLNVFALLLLLQIYSLNIEFYQLQATNTKTGRPAQWALATWAPEGPVSST